MRAIVAVIDGLGAGAIDPAQPYNTLNSIRLASPAGFPFLDRLGLAALPLASRSTWNDHNVTCRRIKPRGEPDTFTAHREMIAATDQSHITTLADATPRIRTALVDSPHRALKIDGLLTIDDKVTICDNLDAEPGLSLLVLADDTVPEQQLNSIIATIRPAVNVPRLNIHTGPGASPRDVAAAAITKTVDHRELTGVHVGHLDPTGDALTAAYRCAPLRPPHLLSWLTDHNHPVTLLGKAPDLFPDTAATVVKYRSFDLFDTSYHLTRSMDSQKRGLIFVNYAQVDFAGHRQDPDMAARDLSHIDNDLASAAVMLTSTDLFIILADHGNDPNAGHPRHTHEHVPLIIFGGTALPQTLPPGLSLIDQLVKHHLS